VRLQGLAFGMLKGDTDFSINVGTETCSVAAWRFGVSFWPTRHLAAAQQ